MYNWSEAASLASSDCWTWLWPEWAGRAFLNGPRLRSLFLLFLFATSPGSVNTDSVAAASGNRHDWFACILLKLTGLWVMPEGNVILIGNEKFEVAEACNGLSMLIEPGGNSRGHGESRAYLHAQTGLPSGEYHPDRPG